MSLRIAALGLLTQHPGSGYDLLKRFQLSMAHVWPATQSQLYGELNKLAEAGMIEVSDIGPRGRKEYRVTDAGRDELVRWITTPHDDPPRRRPDVLRFFLLSEVPVADARTYVTSFAANAAEELKEYERLRDSVPWADDAADFYARAALEYGLRNAAMEVEWANWLVTAIDERARKKM